MDVFRKGRGDSQEFTLRPPVPGLRNLMIGAAVLVAVIFLLSFVVRVTRIEAGHVGVEINLAGSQRAFICRKPFANKFGCRGPVAGTATCAPRT